MARIGVTDGSGLDNPNILTAAVSTNHDSWREDEDPVVWEAAAKVSAENAQRIPALRSRPRLYGAVIGLWAHRRGAAAGLSAPIKTLRVFIPLLSLARSLYCTAFPHNLLAGGVFP
jgi:hypothetical protein